MRARAARKRRLREREDPLGKGKVRRVPRRMRRADTPRAQVQKRRAATSSFGRTAGVEAPRWELASIRSPWASAPQREAQRKMIPRRRRFPVVSLRGSSFRDFFGGFSR